MINCGKSYQSMGHYYACGAKYYHTRGTNDHIVAQCPECRRLDVRKQFLQDEDSGFAEMVTGEADLEVALNPTPEMFRPAAVVLPDPNEAAVDAILGRVANFRQMQDNKSIGQRHVSMTIDDLICLSDYIKLVRAQRHLAQHKTKLEVSDNE